MAEGTNMRRAAILAAIAAAALAASCGPRGFRRAPRSHQRDGRLVDFEGRDNPFVASGDEKDCKIVSGTDNPLGPGRALRLTLRPWPYPGVSMEMPSGGRRDLSDWSGSAALVFDCYNGSPEAAKLSVRMDDELSTGYTSRLNLENWLTLKPGRTRCVLPLAGVELGSVGSRGLDLSKVRSLHLFVLGVKKPLTLYLDAFRLEKRQRPEGIRVRVMPETLTANEGARVDRAADGSVGLSISGGRYPGFKFGPDTPDWLGYDFLEIAGDSTAARSLVLKVADHTGRSAQCVTRIGKGRFAVRMPVHLLGELDLSRVVEVVVFSTPKPEGKVTVRSLVLVRPGGGPPALRGPLPEGTVLELDGSAIAEVGRNSGLAFIIWPPGRRPIVRTPRSKGDLRHVVPVEGMPLYGATTVPVAAYFFDHGMRHYASGELAVRPGKRSVWKPAAADFSH